MKPARSRAKLPEEEFILFVGDLRPMKGSMSCSRRSRTRRCDPTVLIGKSWPTQRRASCGGHRAREVAERGRHAAFRRSAIAVVPSVWARTVRDVVIEAMAGARRLGSDIGEYRK